METISKIAGFIMLACGWAFIVLLCIGCGMSDKSKNKDTVIMISWYLRWVLLAAGVVFLVTFILK